MTKKLFFLFVILSISLFGYSQYLTIEGKAYGSDLKEKEKIYYAFEGKRFNKNLFILLGKDNSYVFKMGLSKIKQEKNKTIVFTQDINSSTTEDYACVYKINLEEIRGNNPKVKSDLLVKENCSFNMAQMVDEKEKQYIGSYLVEGSQEIRLVLLELDYGCKVKYKTRTDSLITEEIGWWSYDKTNKIKVHISRLQNPEIGIIVLTDKDYLFDLPKDGAMKLEK